MSAKKPEQPRAERLLPGIWRLRLPLFWPGVPHGNVWAVAADGGIWSEDWLAAVVGLAILALALLGFIPEPVLW